MSLEYDLHSEIRAVQVYEDAVFAITNEAFTREIDMEDATEGGGMQSLEWVVTVGTIDVAGGTVEMRCQESDSSGSGFTDVTANAEDGADLILGGEDLTVEAGKGIVIPATGSGDTTYRMGCLSKKRFQRLAMTEETAVTAGQITVTAILGNPKRGPVADQSS